MRLLPTSPRRRRRVAPLGVLAALAGIAAGIVVVVPSGHGTPTAVPTGPYVPVAPPEQEVRLTRADRVAIDRMFDTFVPAVIERKNLAAGYDTVTPDMRGHQTRDEWARSDPPVQFVRVRGNRFHEWSLTYAYPKEASISLQVHTRGNPKGPQAISFDVDLHRIDGRWLVDSVAPAAIFGNDLVSAAPDFGAPGAKDATTTEARLSGEWIAVPLAVLGLVPAALVLWWLLMWARDRTRRRLA